MATTTTMFDWRGRDDRFFGFIDKHAATTKQIVKARIFPSYKVANRRIVRMKKRTRGRKPRVVGTVALHDTGREALVYCGWRPRAIKHEVLLTEWLLDFGFPMDRWNRGMNTSSKYKPDAECSKLMVEIDTGTEKRKQLQSQILQQRDSEKPTLWVVHSLARFNWIEEVANKEKTLMTLVGSNEIYDMHGKCVTVDKYCRYLLDIINNQ